MFKFLGSNRNTATIAMMVGMVAGGVVACNQNTEVLPEQKPASTAVAAAAQPPQFQATVQDVPVVLPECEGQYCPQITIQRLNSNIPELNQVIDAFVQGYLHNLLQGYDIDAASAEQASSTAQHSSLPEHPASSPHASSMPTDMQATLQQDIAKFYHLAAEVKALGSSSQLMLNIKPEIVDQQLPIIAVMIHANHYVGGAHGSATDQYVNYDLSNQAILNLDDMILPAKRKALNELAYAAYQQWIRQTQPGIDSKEYQSLWPFTVSDNFYLGSNGLVLQYGEYEIGPYAVGLPRLVIPYSKLQGVLKAHYLPDLAGVQGQSGVLKKPE
jgi:hypothetical protein